MPSSIQNYFTTRGTNPVVEVIILVCKQTFIEATQILPKRLPKTGKRYRVNSFLLRPTGSESVFGIPNSERMRDRYRDCTGHSRVCAGSDHARHTHCACTPLIQHCNTANYVSVAGNCMRIHPCDELARCGSDTNVQCRWNILRRIIHNTNANLRMSLVELLYHRPGTVFR